ncbi:hypothetical protein [Halobacteriovorax sp.]|uniref:hypothetical protein n=1 Tax=Halobacteriovorax sp. TaxID=2020862 RepID=UPI0035643A87
MKLLNCVLIVLTLLLVINVQARSGIGGLSGGSSNGKIRDLLQESAELGRWDVVREVVAKKDKFTLSGDRVFLGTLVSAFKVCIEGDDFRSIEKHPVYKAEYVGVSRDYNDGRRDGWQDVLVGHEYKRYPIVYTKYEEKCSNSGKRCRKVEKVVKQDSLKNITVKEHVRTLGRSNPRKIYEEVTSESYEISECN